jgi:hypothetical protein
MTRTAAGAYTINFPTSGFFTPAQLNGTLCVHMRVEVSSVTNVKTITGNTTATIATQLATVGSFDIYVPWTMLITYF